MFLLFLILLFPFLTLPCRFLSSFPFSSLLFSSPPSLPFPSLPPLSLLFRTLFSSLFPSPSHDVPALLSRSCLLASYTFPLQVLEMMPTAGPSMALEAEAPKITSNKPPTLPTESIGRSAMFSESRSIVTHVRSSISLTVNRSASRSERSLLAMV